MILGRFLLLGAACWTVMMLHTSAQEWALEGAQQQKAGQQLLFNAESARRSRLKTGRTVWGRLSNPTQRPEKL